jgi:hypothetical protein
MKENYGNRLIRQTRSTINYRGRCPDIEYNS